jgi:hypothetical protein
MNFLPRLAWTGTMILLISASQVARITGVNHQHKSAFPLFLLVYDSGHTNYTINLTSCWNGYISSGGKSAKCVQENVDTPITMKEIIKLSSPQNITSELVAAQWTPARLLRTGYLWDPDYSPADPKDGEFSHQQIKESPKRIPGPGTWRGNWQEKKFKHSLQ